MAILEKEIWIKWHNSNKKHYENKGYLFTEYGCLFKVKVKHLTKGSHALINLQCDECGHLNKPIQFKSYIKSSTCKNGGFGSFLCITCHNKKPSYKKWDINKINNFVSKNSSSKLLSKEYKCIDEKMKFICKCGSPFHTSWNKFLKRGKRQCNRCGRQKGINFEHVQKVINNYGCELLTKEYSDTMQRLNVRCRCGETFKTSYHHFTRKNNPKNQCEMCTGVSKCVSLIREYLNNKMVKYDTEHMYEDCKNICPLKFDFNVQDVFLLEYDGEQHFRPVNSWGGDGGFKKRLINDQIKNEYCTKNNIPLIRIPYWEQSNIEDILENVLGYYKIIHKNDINHNLIRKYLVNDPEWLHEKYLELCKNNGEVKELIAT